MELSLGGLIGAMVGAALGGVNFAIIGPMIDQKLRAADKPLSGEDLESRITTARRSVLAFNMLVFVGAGYWAGTALGG
jgi:hypothetical protein